MDKHDAAKAPGSENPDVDEWGGTRFSWDQTPPAWVSAARHPHTLHDLSYSSPTTFSHLDQLCAKRVRVDVRRVWTDALRKSAS